MKQTSLPPKNNLIHRGIHIAIICVLISLLIPTTPSAAAQVPTGDWEQPINLSQSGSSTAPEIVLDSNGNEHYIWLDEFAGYRYTKSIPEGGWAPPVSVVFPFGQYQPRLVSEANKMISAFWKSNENALYVSQVREILISNGKSWSVPRLLSPEVLAYDVTVNSDGIIHLVYYNLIETDTYPSGIYYRRTLPWNNGWTEPSLIYPSLYLRGVPIEFANVKVATQGINEEEVIYVVWDETPHSKIYFGRSTDKGKNWDTPVEVDNTSKEAGSVIPFGIDIATWGNQVMMAWKRGDPQNSCTVYYQASADHGETWPMHSSMAESIPGCAVNSGFLANHPNALLWEASFNNQVYLTAWDGNHWSSIQLQSALSSIIDPLTERTLRLGCWKIVASPKQDQLIAAGCDLDGNRDIWLATKTFSSIENWFLPENGWNRPMEIFDRQNEIRLLQLLTDTTGNLYSFWVQSQVDSEGENLERSGSGSGPHDAVYYATWNGSTWSPPVAILQNATGKIGHLSVVLSPEGILYAIWQGDQTGQIYFSWANAARAIIPAEWAEPIPLPVPVEISRLPEIAVSGEVVYVIYSVPINEMRGIYMTRSADGGRVWSAPLQVFDGQAANWEVVGGPALALTHEGHLHAMWLHETLPGTRGSFNLFYARSSDDGDTWSIAEPIMEGKAAWGEMVTSPSGELYQIWQNEDAPNIIRARTSSDSGNTWTPLESLALNGNPIGPIDTFFDPAGKMHLIHFAQDQTENIIMQDWEQQDRNWTFYEYQKPTKEMGTVITNLAGTVSSAGTFTVIFSTAHESVVSNTPQNKFFVTGRTVELREMIPTAVLPLVDPGPEEIRPTASEPRSTATIAATLTPAFTSEISEDLSSGYFSTTGKWTGLIISIVLSSLVVGIGFLALLSRNKLH